jgi:hypothetical protein
MMTAIPVSAEVEAFYQEVIAGLKGAIDRHPSMRILEQLAVVGRLAGYLTAACYPDERDLCKHVVMVNLEAGLEALGQPGPSTTGHA